MAYEQVYSIINAMYAQTTGKTDIAVVDTSSFIFPTVHGKSFKINCFFRPFSLHCNFKMFSSLLLN